MLRSGDTGVLSQGHRDMPQGPAASVDPSRSRSVEMLQIVCATAVRAICAARGGGPSGIAALGKLGLARLESESSTQADHIGPTPPGSLGQARGERAYTRRRTVAVSSLAPRTEHAGLVRRNCGNPTSHDHRS